MVLKGNTEATMTYQGQNQALSNANIINVLCISGIINLKKKKISEPLAIVIS
jgi:hypothetical protein